MNQQKDQSKTEETFLRISRIQIGYRSDALGIGTNAPFISWMIETNIQNWCQKSYEIESYNDDGKLLSTTGTIDSDQTIWVPWPFEKLNSREKISIRVKSVGDNGYSSEWSDLFVVEAGLLNPQDWTAKFITPDWDEDVTKGQPAPFLRRTFDVPKKIKQARLYITSLGVFEAVINGSQVGDHIMDPGWTSYTHNLRVNTFDVTSLLREGKNTIGSILGDGWYRGRLGFGGGRRNIFGNKLALLAQLEIMFKDGTFEKIISDENWKASTGPILFSDIYDGEIYDARRELTGWAEPEYSDANWKKVKIIDWDLNTLEAPLGPPVREIENVKPVSILTSPTGRTILDFGQNLVGKLKINVKGEAGRTISLRHAEVLENGDLALFPLRTAKATDSYTLHGKGLETWEPRFTFHGFRYAEIENWPGSLNLDDIQAVVCHSDMEQTGWFKCSHPLLNKFHENVVWGMRGNFFDLPTDCPQRDERLGWTGDLQVFSPTASFLYNVEGFLASWLKDLAAEQIAEGGKVPAVVPNTVEYPNELSETLLIGAAWSDAAVIVPWVLYQRFGDKNILEAQFESMRTWVDKVNELAGPSHLWNSGLQFGDWLDPDAPAEYPAKAKTDQYLIATGYFAHVANLVGKAADILGKNKEKIYYQTLSKEIRKAFNREYVTPNGRLMSDAQTAYALAIEFDLLPEETQKIQAGKRLAELTTANGYHIGTGFVGTPLIADALSNTNHYEEAYKLLLQQECPSWLYPVTMGATTIWERWDSMRPDGSINTGDMTSFNHYALGAVADWLHRKLAGLTPLEPGYRTIKFDPHPGGGLRHASARHLTPYGMAECSWVIQNDMINIKVVVPPNATGFVCLQGNENEPIKVGSGEYHWSYTVTGNK